MKTYTPDQLVILDSGQIDQVQKSIDGDALAFLDDKKEELDFLNPEEQAHLKEYYTDTMEKYRLLYEAVVSGFATPNSTGFPEYIYNINLKDGSIETDRNGRHISYSTEILAPCTTAMLHYINSECNNVYVIIPPIKGVERTTEKLISECIREYKTERAQNLEKFAEPPFEEEPELPFPLKTETGSPLPYRSSPRRYARSSQNAAVTAEHCQKGNPSQGHLSPVHHFQISGRFGRADKRA